MNFPSILFAAVLTVGGGLAQAATNLVTNGSFELGTAGIGSFAGWTTSVGDAATFVDSSGQTGTHPGQASDGRWSAYFGSTGASGGATISQRLATTVGQTYLLSFDLANDNGGAAASNGFTASIGAGGVRSFAALGSQDYAQQTMLFTAGGASTQLAFSGYNDNGYLQLDKVSVTAAVPEPSVAVLSLAGLALIGLRRVRQAPGPV